MTLPNFVQAYVRTLLIVGLVLFGVAPLTSGHAQPRAATHPVATPTQRVIAGVAACFTEITGDSTPDYQSSDAQALRDAITSAAPGAIVKVAGTCTGVSNGQLVSVNKALMIRGGYTSSNWTTSNPSANPTTLDAATSGRVVVVTSTGVTLDGLTIINGRSPNGGGGGGVLVIATGLFTLTNSIITNNATIAQPARNGGGVQISGSLASISNTRFEGNLTAGTSSEGGALYTDKDIAISDSIFRNNSATSAGGAVSAQNVADVTVRNTLFEHNQSGTNAGALFVTDYLTMTDSTMISNTTNLGDGGGAYVLSGVRITNCLFSQNRTNGGDGGALGIQNGTSASVIRASTFISNTASQNGGGLHVLGEAKLVQVEQTRFEANSAGIEGGGLFAAANTATLPISVSASLFLRNSSVQGGGGVYIGNGGAASLDNNLFGSNRTTSGPTDIGLGGSSGPATLTGRHNTFVAPVSNLSTSIIIGNDVDNEQITLINSIFDGYTFGVVRGARPATLTITGVLWSNVATPTSGTGITVTGAMTGNPHFVNRAAENYHIQSNSAAIDKGVSTTLTNDYDGDTRSSGSAADLGFDEYLNQIHIFLPTIAR